MSRKLRKARLDIVNADTTSNSELILDLIMPYLSTRDCVRTSILSSKWRYRWTTIPNLVFDENCHPQLREDNIKSCSRVLASIINGVLLRHNGSIQTLQIKDICIIPDIDYWVFHASKGPVTTFVLELFHMEFQYKLPSSLYTFGSLVNLKLVNCLLRPPSYFNGFKKLKCLHLEFVTLTNDVFENLISSCPLLEKLTVLYAEGLDHPFIDARNLESIEIGVDFENITFESALPRLLVFSIDQNDCSKLSDYEGASLTELFMKLPNIQRFVLRNFSIRYLANHSIPESTPFQFKDLYLLSICTDFGDRGESLAVLYLFRCSPNLTELMMEAWDLDGLDEAPVWGDREKCCWEFKKLRLVKLDNFRGTRTELNFMEFVLGNSPVLEKMTINPHSNDMKWKDVKSLYGMKRASEAEIIFDGVTI